MAHTPGPWEIDEDDMYSVYNGDYRKIRAGVGFYDDIGAHGTPGGFGLCGILSRQDARLIAAAPDLLEACEDVLMALKNGEAYASTRVALEHAIAKAKGLPNA